MKIFKDFTFEAAHRLPNVPEGHKCARLHGHSYKVEAVLENDKLQQYDLAIDFAQAKKALEAIAKELDYSYINHHPEFAGRNTSAENIARWFAERLDSSGMLGWTRVAEVTVREGPENRARYVPPTGR
jgi:6-pyruvoyltetrahydropterin/6-carboxytetrahydropterin synthase